MSWEKIFGDLLDEKDIKILKLLNKDATLSDAKIGRIIGLSKTAVRLRRVRMINKGYLRIVGLVILQSLSLPYADILIKLKKDTNLRDTFMQLVLTSDTIYEVDEYIGGDWDLLVRIFHKNIDLLSNEINRLVANDAVENYKVLMVAKTRKAWGSTVLGI